MNQISKFFKPMNEAYQDYLSDESRLSGSAEYIAFPEDESQICEILETAHREGMPVTVSAGRTGITGGAVPRGGAILSLERMNRFLNLEFDTEKMEWFARVQPGLSLAELELALKRLHGNMRGNDCNPPALFLPPDPTEKTAGIGGAVACDASGARSFGFASIRRYVRRLRVALASGFLLDIPRNLYKADHRGIIEIPARNHNISLKIPTFFSPGVKNVAGYFSFPGMDLVDLFIGSEGTLGIITEVELALKKVPDFIFGAVLYFPYESDALRFVRIARSGNLPGLEAFPEVLRPQALEYFGKHALDLLRERREALGPEGPIPHFPDQAGAACYFEIMYDDEEIMDSLMEYFEKSLPGCGGSLDDSWAESDTVGINRMREFRHALPEAVNSLIGQIKTRFPHITKLGTDFAVPDDCMERVMKLYRHRLADTGLRHVIFGHIGDNHVHVNIIPQNDGEYKNGKALFMEFARAVVDMGGTVAAEHGIGKIKKELLKIMIGEKGLQEMREIKKALDPKGILNPGNLFDE